MNIIAMHFWLLFTLCSSYTAVAQQNVQPRQIPILNFTELEPLLKTDSDSVFVVNFWATWCAPCVKELPYFEKLNSEYAEKKVKVLLISLDFKSQVATTLKNFITKNNIQSSVIVLVDKKMDEWIPKVNAEWKGSIPATLIFTKNKRFFAEKEYEDYESLTKQVNIFLNIE